MGRKVTRDFNAEMEILSSMATRKGTLTRGEIEHAFELDPRTANDYRTVVEKCFDDKGQLTGSNYQYVTSVTTLCHMVKNFTYDQLCTLKDKGLFGKAGWGISQSKFRAEVSRYKQFLKHGNEMDTTPGVLRPMTENDKFGAWIEDNPRLLEEYPAIAKQLFDLEEGQSLWENEAKMVLFTNVNHAIVYHINLLTGEQYSVHYDPKEPVADELDMDTESEMLEIEGL